MDATTGGGGKNDKEKNIASVTGEGPALLSESQTQTSDPFNQDSQTTQSLSIDQIYTQDQIKDLRVGDLMKNSKSEEKHKKRKDEIHVINRKPAQEKQVLDQERFDKHYGFRRVDLNLGRKVNWHFRQIGKWHWADWCSFFSGRLPITRWLPAYQWKEWILADLIGGIMVSIMCVPQGLAYGYLVGVPPKHGLITSIFAPFIYALMGTSRHTSPGSFAIVALMVGSAVEQFGLNSNDEGGSYHGNDTLVSLCCHTKAVKISDAEALGVAGAITLLIGLCQIVFGLLNAGLLAVWLSDHLVQGLTSGAAVHVLTSQLKSMTEITEVPPTSEPFGLIKFYICFVSQIQSIKLAASVTSLISVFLLLLSSYFIDPILKKWTVIKFPMEFFLVICSVLLVYLAEGTQYQLDLKYVGSVESGLAWPCAPPMDRAGEMLNLAISIAVVSFVIHIALAKLVSKKLNYEIDANQEWLALGTMHTVSAFFGCFAGGSSLGRTMMQVKCGTKTQLSTLVCCLILLIFVYGAAELIYYLPKAVLACIVVVAMKDLFIQLYRASKLYKKSIVDFLIFAFTFVAVILINVNYGLIIGVAFALLSVVFRSQWAESTCMGRIPGTSDFKGLGHYKSAEEIPGVKVFRFDAPLYFANAELFITRMYRACGLNPILVRAKMTEEQLAAEARRKKKQLKNAASIEEEMAPLKDDTQLEMRVRGRKITMTDGEQSTTVNDAHDQLTHIIIDCSSIPYVDLMGKDALAQVFADYASIEIVVLYAHCKVSVRQMFETCDFYQRVPKNRMFVSLNDAVSQATKERSARFPEKTAVTDASTAAGTNKSQKDHPVAHSPAQRTLQPTALPSNERDDHLQGTQSLASRRSTSTAFEKPAEGTKPQTTRKRKQELDHTQ